MEADLVSLNDNYLAALLERSADEEKKARKTSIPEILGSSYFAEKGIMLGRYVTGNCLL